MWVGREGARARWARPRWGGPSAGAPADGPAPKPKWRCINAPPGSTWNWWGTTNGEAFAVGGSAAEEGLGWFNAIRAVHRRWASEERASATLGLGAGRKVSSTVQELRCLTSAVTAWVETRPAYASVFNYFSDAANLGFLLKKGRSSKEIINLELRRIHELCADSALHIRVHWSPRSSWAGVMADHLSRGSFQAFKETSARFGSRRGRMHPCL